MRISLDSLLQAYFFGYSFLGVIAMGMAIVLHTNVLLQADPGVERYELPNQSMFICHMDSKTYPRTLSPKRPILQNVSSLHQNVLKGKVVEGCQVAKVGPPTSPCKVLGCKVQVLKAYWLEFRAFRVLGLGCRVYGLGHRMQGLGQGIGSLKRKQTT